VFALRSILAEMAKTRLDLLLVARGLAPTREKAQGMILAGQVRTGDGEWTIGDGRPGPTTRRLRDTLLGLQEGRADDPFGWRVPVAASVQPSLLADGPLRVLDEHPAAGTCG